MASSKKSSKKTVRKSRPAVKAKPSKKPAAKKTAPRRAATASSNGASLEGRKAPAFTLPDREGGMVSLSDLTGSGNLVLYFYPKDMTPGCTIEACSFRDNLSSIRALGAQVVGISGDSEASHQRFTDKYELNFPLLADKDNNVGKAYGVYKMKSLYGRQFMGIERTTFVIDRTGVIRKVFPKVRVNGHTDEVVEALKSLG
jgi:thioredoxin-dependent peroxiredoxin